MRNSHWELCVSNDEIHTSIDDEFIMWWSVCKTNNQLAKFKRFCITNHLKSAKMVEFQILHGEQSVKVIFQSVD